MQTTPPIGRVTGDDPRQFDPPLSQPLPANGVAQAGIFRPDAGVLFNLDFLLLIFGLELLDLLQQILPGGQSAAGLFRDLMSGAGETKERQEKSADGQLDLPHCLGWQLEQRQNDQDDHN